MLQHQLSFSTTTCSVLTSIVSIVGDVWPITRVSLKSSSISLCWCEFNMWRYSGSFRTSPAQTVCACVGEHCLRFHQITSQSIWRPDWTWKCPAGLASITIRMWKLFLSLLLAQLVSTESGSNASLHFHFPVREGAQKQVVRTSLFTSLLCYYRTLTLKIHMWSSFNEWLKNDETSSDRIKGRVWSTHRLYSEKFSVSCNCQALNCVPKLLDLQDLLA